MAKKLNMVAVKELFIKHGEKVALGACAFIAITFGIIGLMRAGSAGNAEGTPMANKSWQAAFKDVKTRIDRERESVQPTEMPKEIAQKLKPENYDWEKHFTTFETVPYFNQPDNLNANKRYNPVALCVERDPKFLPKLEYINGAYLYYQTDLAAKTVDGLSGPTAAGAGGINPMQPMPGDIRGGTGTGGTGIPLNYAHYARPSRMIVGTMVFPLKKLMSDYVKALRLESQKDLFDFREDLPRFEGFNLLRFEVLPNGEFANKNGELIIGYDSAAQEMKVSEPLKRMLREAVYDEQLPVNLEPYLFAGLSMPMPKLANRKYAKPNLPGFDFASWDDGTTGVKKDPMGMMPMPGGGGGIVLPGGGKKGGRPDLNPNPMDPMGGVGGVGGGPEQKIEAIKYKDVVKSDPHLANRLFNKSFEKDFNYYHVFGYKAPVMPIDGKGGPMDPRMPMGNQGMPNMAGQGAKDETRFFAPWDVNPAGADGENGMPGGGGIVRPGGGGIVRPGGGGNPMPGDGGMGMGGEVKNWDRDAIVRFIDVDLVPGKTYQYAIQVRIANPNYKKPNIVAFTALSNNAELPLNKSDSWVLSEMATIPHEYFVYAVDQNLIDEWNGEKMNKKDKKEVIGIRDKDHLTTVQVQQWVKYKDDRVVGAKHAIGDWAVAERLIVRRGDEIGLATELQVPVWRETKNAFDMPLEIKEGNKKQLKPGIKIDLRPVVFEKDDREIALPPPVLVDFAGGKRFKSSGAVEEEVAQDVLLMDSTGKLVLRNSRIDADMAFPPSKERQERVVSMCRRNTEVMNAGTSMAAPYNGPMLPGGGRTP